MKKPDVVSFLKLSFDLLLNGYSLPLADHAIQSVTQERQQGNFLKDCQNSAAMKSSPPPIGFFKILHPWDKRNELHMIILANFLQVSNAHSHL